MGDGVYIHRLAVRKGELDLHGQALPSHYLTYCDEAFEGWFRTAGILPGDHDWDVVVKRVLIEWQGTAGLRDILDIGVGVQRWGTTTFDVGFSGTVSDLPVFEALVTYTGVRHGTRQPMATPAAVRELLGDPPA